MTAMVVLMVMVMVMVMVMGFMFPSARVLRVPRVPEAVALVHVHTEQQPVARAVSLARAVERLHQLPGGRHVREGATAALV